MFTLQLLPHPTTTSDQKQKTVEQQFLKDNLIKELLVLEEQSQQVEHFLVEAISRRKFEDAQMLKESYEELLEEISRKKVELQSLD